MSDDDPVRSDFEVWFTATYGPPPDDAALLANLAEAARIEAFMGGAWAAWKRCHAYLVMSPGAGLSAGEMVVSNMTPAELDMAPKDDRTDAEGDRRVAATADPGAVFVNDLMKWAGS